MKVLNGKWVDQYDEPLEYHVGGKYIKTLGEGVISVFGDDEITTDRINIIRVLSEKNQTTEKAVGSILNNQEILNKLSGL